MLITVKHKPYNSNFEFFSKRILKKNPNLIFFAPGGGGGGGWRRGGERERERGGGAGSAAGGQTGKRYSLYIIIYKISSS